MKRLALIGLIVLTSFLSLATSASAILFFFAAPSSTNPAIGEQITVELRMDTELETQIGSVFVSTFVDDAVLSFASGTSPGQILFNASTFEGVGRVSQPFTLPTDPPGNVRAASFATLTPPGVASDDQLLATLTFDVVGEGAVNVVALIELGDDVTVDGVSQIGLLGFIPSDTITVPEPASMLLSLSALGMVWMVRRRRVA